MSRSDVAPAGSDIAGLLTIMALLRTPGTGCDWDIAQDFASIAPYTIEEAYEVVDAIERGDLEDLRDELGDLLLQVVFHARMAEERGAFAFPDVVEAIASKMIRRHPHVFGDVADRSPEAIRGSWNRIKAEEKAERRARRIAAGAPDKPPGLLTDIPASLPPLARALRMQQRAATVGFDWPTATEVTNKIDEEIGEVKQALASYLSCVDAGGDTMLDLRAVEDEIGDAMFALVNLARHVGVDPERAIASTNQKFTFRFNYVEEQVHKSGKDFANTSLDEMEAHWVAAKRL